MQKGARHLRAVLSYDRNELEYLLLLAAEWRKNDLRPSSLAARRVGVIYRATNPELEVALQVAAHAASVQLLQISDSFAANPTEAGRVLGPLLDAVVLADPAGIHEDWYSQSEIPVINLISPTGAPLEVIGHLHRQLTRGGSINGLPVLWSGDASPALQSWVEATGDLDLHVTQVAANTTIAEAFLVRLRSEGQIGSFAVTEQPSRTGLDAREPLDARTWACVIAAAFEFSLHRI